MFLKFKIYCNILLRVCDLSRIGTRVGKQVGKLLQADTKLAPVDQLDGLYGRIEQHLGIISHAQNKIMLLQEIAEQNDEG